MEKLNDKKKKSSLLTISKTFSIGVLCLLFSNMTIAKEESKQSVAEEVKELVKQSRSESEKNSKDGPAEKTDPVQTSKCGKKEERKAQLKCYIKKYEKVHKTAYDQSKVDKKSCIKEYASNKMQSKCQNLANKIKESGKSKDFFLKDKSNFCYRIIFLEAY